MGRFGAGDRHGQIQKEPPWLLNGGWTRGSGMEAGGSGKWLGRGTGEMRGWEAEMLRRLGAWTTVGGGGRETP